MEWDEVKKIKHIRLMPEYGGCCFWDSTGCGCGDCENVLLDDDTELDTSVLDGLERWSLEYDYSLRDEDYRKYWNPEFRKDYSERGLAIAKEFRKILPAEYALFLHIPEFGIKFLLVDENTAL